MSKKMERIGMTYQVGSDRDALLQYLQKSPRRSTVIWEVLEALKLYDALHHQGADRHRLIDVLESQIATLKGHLKLLESRLQHHRQHSARQTTGWPDVWDGPEQPLTTVPIVDEEGWLTYGDDCIG